MVACIDELAEIADRFDAIVLDQWGVLHDGGAPLPGAVAALEALRADGRRLAVLSNSGKRAAPNAARIAAMGFPEALFEVVMTSGEALWRRFLQDERPRRLYLIERAPGDGAEWAAGLDLTLTDRIERADAVLLMGLPDEGGDDAFADAFSAALERGLPLYCSNPDLASPRPGGRLVTSPGALARRFEEAGGAVRYFGKPHRPVFDALAQALDAAPERLLMVGDSLHHDILGGARAGWRTLLIRSGVHAAALAGEASTVAALAAAEAVPPPDYSMERLN
jgi:HAD superfamily hydrolase (TIGR01459 family)